MTPVIANLIINAVITQGPKVALLVVELLERLASGKEPTLEEFRAILKKNTEKPYAHYDPTFQLKPGDVPGGGTGDGGPTPLVPG